MTQNLNITALFLLLGAGVAEAQPAGIRDACKQFIQRSDRAPVNADWGDYWNWTVVDNKDGTYSIGGKYRYASGGFWRNGYTTCVIKIDGKDFVLEKLSRMM